MRLFWSRITKYICSLCSKSTKCSRPRLAAFLSKEKEKHRCGSQNEKKLRRELFLFVLCAMRGSVTFTSIFFTSSKYCVTRPRRSNRARKLRAIFSLFSIISSLNKETHKNPDKSLGLYGFVRDERLELPTFAV